MSGGLAVAIAELADANRAVWVPVLRGIAMCVGDEMPLDRLVERLGDVDCASAVSTEVFARWAEVEAEPSAVDFHAAG